MRKKIGTMICMTCPEVKGHLFLTEAGHLCVDSRLAKTYNASGKVLNTIVAQTEKKYPGFTVSRMERWSID